MGQWRDVQIKGCPRIIVPVWFLYQSFLFRCREFEVEILDREFDPPILVIQEGDRVWWYWDKDKVRSSQWSPDNGPLVLLIACVNKLRFVKCVYLVKLPCASHFSIKLVAPSILGFIFAVTIYLFSISWLVCAFKHPCVCLYTYPHAGIQCTVETWFSSRH